MNKKRIALLVVFAVLALACTCSALPSIVNTPVVAVNNPPPVPTENKILAQDDFSSSSSGWYTETADEYVMSYSDGGYLIQVIADDMDAWGTWGRAFPADVNIEVDAVLSSGPEASSYGILCRYTDNSNYYSLIVSNDGYAVIMRKINDVTDVISDPNQNWTGSDAINVNGINRIRADCIGNTLTLYANGIQILSVSDPSLTSGDVGLVASTWGTGGANVLFDNMVVKRP
jgi:hypothetical protein